jgi:3-phenylpropionate/trans-cinnamate dioxygenase ferredoxin reductase component
MSEQATHVIVGGGLAGGKAAETLRSEGFDGRVIIVGEEPVRPYERPPLSKGYLRGEQGFDDAAVHGEDFYSSNDIELRSANVVTGLDLTRHELTLDDGDTLSFNRLLLCTGAVPRRLSVPGAELDGVRYLRTVADADLLRQAFTPSRPVVVIGAGWIGSEVAASARQLGAEVTMIDLASVPLERVLGAEIGAVFAELHHDHGVRTHFETGIDAIVGADRVEGVRLSDGTVIAADVVVVGVGVSPRVELADGAGLVVDNGVVVDEYLQTSDPDVFAAGDVANAFHPGYGARIRLEHWAAALHQGPAAAQNMLGHRIAYDRTPYFFSDQYEFGMEYRGWAPSFDDVVVRGDLRQREFISFWRHGGRVVAAMNANVWDDGDALQELVASRTAADADDLSNPSVDLAELSRLG